MTTSVSTQIDCLVAGDKELLVLSGIRIIRPGDFWKLEDVAT